MKSFEELIGVLRKCMQELPKNKNLFCFKEFKKNLTLSEAKTKPSSKEDNDWIKREIGALWKKSFVLLCFSSKERRFRV